MYSQASGHYCDNRAMARRVVAQPKTGGTLRFVATRAARFI
jgi:hypothetical protein